MAWAQRLGDDKKVTAALGNQAIIHYNEGRNRRAMELHKEEEGIYLRIGDRDGGLARQAEILIVRGRPAEAAAKGREAAALATEIEIPFVLEQLKGVFKKFR